MVPNSETPGSVYFGKTVFITGDTGFKGSWLSYWLTSLGARVVGFASDLPSDPCMFALLGLERSLAHNWGDVRDADHVARCMGDCSPDFVFHLAAQPLVRRSYADPRLTYETNVMGTVNVLEAVRATASVRVVVNVTSDKCYDNREWVWGYRENDPLGGHDPYSSSKGCAELVAAAYDRSFFSRGPRRVWLGSVRAGNVIGGGDWGADRLLPDCVRALGQGEAIRIRYPLAVRPWQHVLEPLSGYLLLGARLWEDGSRYGGAWNFGPSEDAFWTVEQVVREMRDLWGAGDYVVDEGPHAREATWLALDCSKARRVLGWRPKLSTRAALEKTVAWYRAFYGGVGEQGLRALTEAQIRDYGFPGPADGPAAGAGCR